MACPMISPARSRLDLDLIRTFVVVLETKSFTGAAERIGRAQSTVSTQIKLLEERLGATLFHRGRRSILPTVEGQSFSDYALQLLELEVKAVSSVRRSQIAGTVRLGTQDDFAIRRLPGILAQFGQIFPAISVEVACGLGRHILQQLRKGDLDVALIRQSAGITSGEQLWSEEVAWIGTSAGKLDLSKPLPLVLYPEGCFYRKIISQSLVRHGLTSHVTFTSSNSASVQEAVKAGLGVSALAQATVQENTLLMPRKCGLPRLGTVRAALHRSPKRQNKAADRLADFLSDQLRQMHDVIGVGSPKVSSPPEDAVRPKILPNPESHCRVAENF